MAALKSQQNLIVFIISFFIAENCFAENLGLKNRGSDCYFNALMQCLSNLKEFNHFLDKNTLTIPLESVLGRYKVLIDSMKAAPKNVAFAGHSIFIDELQKKFKADSFEAILCGFFRETPEALRDAMKNLAFAQEERKYIFGLNEWKTFYVFGGYPPLSFISRVGWSSDVSGRDWISRDKFMKNDSSKYNLGDDYIKKIDFITKVYDKQIELSLESIKKEIRERIKPCYTNSSGTKIREYPNNREMVDIDDDNKIKDFIKDLENEEFWLKFGLSPEEVLKLFSLSNETKISLIRNFIPSKILILPAETDYPLNLVIEKKYCIDGISNDITYEAKALYAGTTFVEQLNGVTPHAWAYLKDVTGDWVQYDDEQISNLGIKIVGEIRSLKYGKHQGDVNLIFYELDDVSKTVVDSYHGKNALLEKLNTLKSGLKKLNDKLRALKLQLDGLKEALLKT